MSKATPRASAPLEQAETVAKFAPFAPSSIDTCPDAMSGSIIGTRNGLIRDAPRSFNTPICCSSVMMPPIPLETITDTRSRLPASTLRPDCATASSAAAAANWTKRSMRFACFRST